MLFQSCIQSLLQNWNGHVHVALIYAVDLNFYDVLVMTWALNGNFKGVVH